MHKKWIILSGVILTTSFFLFLNIIPGLIGQEDIRVVRLFDLDKCIRGGQIPCRWAQNLGGFGYPLFNYVGPLPYYIGEIFYILSNSLTFAAKMMLVVPLVGSFFFAFFLSRIFLNEKLSVLGAFIYSLISFWGIYFYEKDTTGHLWILMFLPASIWAILRLQARLTTIGLLIMSSLITFLTLSDSSGFSIFLPALIILVLFLFLQKRAVGFLKLSILSIGLGLILSAFYWVPLTFEKEFVNINGEISNRPKDSLEIVRYVVLTGNTEVFNYQEGSNWVTFQTNTKTHSIIRLAQYYFPGWEVNVDGKQVEINYKNSMGLMTFIIGEGIHTVDARLYDTPVRILANFTSLGGIFVFLFLLIAQFSKIRKWIFYYAKSLYR